MLMSCARTVASAAPAGPIEKGTRKRKSSPMLSVVEKMRNTSVVTESPTARRIPQMKLYPICATMPVNITKQ